MSHTITATATVSESGSVTSITLVNTSTYVFNIPMSMYGSPYLGYYEDGEDFREALGSYLSAEAAVIFKLPKILGDVLKYVSPACALYVYEIDLEA